MQFSTVLLLTGFVSATVALQCYQYSGYTNDKISSSTPTVQCSVGYCVRDTFNNLGTVKYGCGSSCSSTGSISFNSYTSYCCNYDRCNTSNGAKTASFIFMMISLCVSYVL